MLLSPGCSPRHISLTPSHSRSEENLETPKNSSSINPPRNPNKRAKVLDEDTYVAAIEKIIERDFFPDIPKLRDRIDWLEAIRSGDPVQIRDCQLKILERRRGKALNSEAEGNKTRTLGSNLGTPGSNFGTPSSNFLSISTPFDLGKTPKQAEAEGEESVDDSVDVSLTLDEFFRRYTSEDNDSFSNIMEKVNRKRKERFAYLTEGEREEVKSIETEKRDRITDGFGTSGQPPSTLDGWKYAAKNLLMYNPAENGEAPLTEAEKEVRLKGLTKEISRTNTRFHGKMMDSRPTEEEDTVAVIYAPVAGATPVPMWDRDAERLKKYDLEDLRKTPNPFYVEANKKSEDGYSFVKTPSPAPGVDESPFITWGEIEGTPLRLEPEDTPVGIGGSSDGPHFRIPYPPSRDVKAHSLSREAARNLRERSKMFQKPPLPSPVTVRGGSASPSGRTLSPAAQKFVRNAIANAKSSSSVDECLRASYRGGSPVVGTPKSRRSLTRFGRDGSLASRSPSVGNDSIPPW